MDWVLWIGSHSGLGGCGYEKKATCNTTAHQNPILFRVLKVYLPLSPIIAHGVNVGSLYIQMLESMI